jgi:Family of unknown function (DUF6962)
MQITEPTTMVTDYLITAWCVVLAVKLLGKRSFAGGPVQLWIWVFWVTALAALAGGTAHGFKLYLEGPALAVVWTATVAAIGASAALAVAASVRSFQGSHLPAAHRDSAKRLWQTGVFVTLAGVTIQQSGWGLHQNFNHNDIYHLVQIVGLYYFYRFAVRLRPARE